MIPPSGESARERVSRDTILFGRCSLMSYACLCIYVCVCVLCVCVYVCGSRRAGESRRSPREGGDMSAWTLERRLTPPCRCARAQVGALRLRAVTDTSRVSSYKLHILGRERPLPQIGLSPHRVSVTSDLRVVSDTASRVVKPPRDSEI